MEKKLDPKEFVISRKRKKYKFALFHNNPLCFEVDEWPHEPKPDVIEMGAGTALFSVEFAREQPEQQVLAIDVKGDRLQTGAKRAIQEGLTNVRFLRARTDQLPGILEPQSLTTIWLTFPDPFPKDRHAKRRLTHPSFLAIYQCLLRKDGILYFKTDATTLFQWSLEQLVVGGWHIEELSFDLHNSSLSSLYKTTTTYEQRYMTEGMSINFVAVRPPTVIIA